MSTYNFTQFDDKIKNAKYGVIGALEVLEGIAQTISRAHYTPNPAFEKAFYPWYVTHLQRLLARARAAQRTETSNHFFDSMDVLAISKIQAILETLIALRLSGLLRDVMPELEKEVEKRRA